MYLLRAILIAARDLTISADFRYAAVFAALLLLIGCAEQPATEKSAEKAEPDKAREGKKAHRTEPGYGDPEVALSTVAWSPDGKLLLAGYRSLPVPSKPDRPDAHWVTVWDVKTGKPLQVLKGHDNDITFVGFLPDSKRAITAGGSMVKMWDAREGKQLWSGKVSTPRIVMAALSPDGNRLLTWGGGDYREPEGSCTLLLWDTKTGKLLEYFRGYESVLIKRLIFTPDSKRIYMPSNCYTSQNIYLRILDAAEGKTLESFKIDHGWKFPLAFSPDGKLALSEKRQRHPKLGYSTYFVLWDLASGKVVRRFEDRTDMERVGHGYSKAVAFTPDGKRVLSGDHDGKVRNWETATGKQISSVFLLDDYPGRKGRPPSLNVWLFSPDRKMALTSNERPTGKGGKGYEYISFTLWDVGNGKLLRRLHFAAYKR